ncbi:MAG: hypothetical protein K2H53_07205, partial [Clostridia bacterium]|nr:hypothetical protein [Clostridia bacterium]
MSNSHSIVLSITIILSLFVISACNEEVYYNPQPSLNYFCIDPYLVKYDAIGGVENVRIISNFNIREDDLNMQISNASYIKCKKINSKEYQISVDYNNSVYERRAQIRFNLLGTT